MSSLSRPGSRSRLNRPPAASRGTETASDRQRPITPKKPTDLDEPVLYTAEQAARLLQVRPSWLRRKAAARAVPCRHVGKHLRFTRSDIEAITEMSAQPPRRF